MSTSPISAPGMRVPRRVAAMLRRVVVNWIFATLVVSIGVYLVVPVVTRAREAARLTPCLNHLFHHSRHHGSDVVYLNHDFKVLRVFSCPLCSGPDYPMVFFVGEGCSPDEFLRENEMPAAVVRDSKECLVFFKQQSSYRRIQESFGRHFQ